ncbi:MAG: hypothetical protein ABEI86_07665, partial [Halobacteriaceae archaeon]
MLSRANSTDIGGCRTAETIVTPRSQTPLEFAVAREPNEGSKPGTLTGIAVRANTGSSIAGERLY